MRLFTGLELPASVEAEVDRIVRPWREIAPAVKWSPLANLHITTKFIGEWPEARLGELKDTLAGIPVEPMRIELRGVDWFPEAEHPHSLFAALDSPPRALLELAAQTQEALAGLGIACERKGPPQRSTTGTGNTRERSVLRGDTGELRKYTPHVTLARLNRPPAAELRALREAIVSAGALDFGVIEARSFFLYLSQPESRGSIYKKLAEFSFQ